MFIFLLEQKSGDGTEVAYAVGFNSVSYENQLRIIFF